MDNDMTIGMVFGEEFDAPKLVDSGDYEVILTAEKRVTKNSGKEYLNLDFKIRDDVEQKFKRSHVYESLWRDKNNSNWFDLIKLNKLIKTQKGLATYKDQFTNEDECIQYLNGLKMRVTVEKAFDDYSGEDRNSIKYLSYAPSQFPVSGNAESVAAAPTSTPSDTTASAPSLDEVDLPF